MAQARVSASAWWRCMSSMPVDKLKSHHDFPSMDTPQLDSKKQAITALVQQCSAGCQIIYRDKRGAAWLCSVTKIRCDDEGFFFDLQPTRRVDTAWWRHEKTPAPFSAGSSWSFGGTDYDHTLKCRRYAVVQTTWVDWCMTLDQNKVAEIIAMAEAPKMPVGDLLSILRGVEIE